MMKNQLLELELNKKGYELIAGVDEAGRGPLAGPVVAAAVIFPKDFYHPLINDSKQLSKKQRNLLKEIIEENAISIGVGIVSNETIDTINILEASRLSMELAIRDLKLEPDFILTDFMDINYDNYKAVKFGDKLSHTIAAASIIAKTTRDEIMLEYHNKYPQYGFITNQGYGTKKHIEAIQKHGITSIHRKTFNKVK